MKICGDILANIKKQLISNNRRSSLGRRRSLLINADPFGSLQIVADHCRSRQIANGVRRKFELFANSLRTETATIFSGVRFLVVLIDFSLRTGLNFCRLCFRFSTITFRVALFEESREVHRHTNTQTHHLELLEFSKFTTL